MSLNHLSDFIYFIPLNPNLSYGFLDKSLLTKDITDLLNPLGSYS